MDRFGITEYGFNKKEYNDILSGMESRAKQSFGEDINLSERSPLGMILQIIAWELKDNWQLGEDIYNSAFIDTAEGVSQDAVSKYIAISRKPAQKAIGVLKFEGNKDTTIPKGFRASTENTLVIFETTERGVTDIDGFAEIPIVALVAGQAGNTPQHSITRIVNPVSGINKVYNEESTVNGTEIESDMEFRERYYRSVSMGGSSTRESVESALLDIPDISDAFVEENDTMEFKGDIPPKSLAPYVFGGTDLEIAQTILLTKAGGIRSFGAIEQDIEDSKGIKHTIGFTRPTVKDLYIKLAITRGLGYVGDEEIKKAILGYIGGTGYSGHIYKGLRLGEDVIISRIISVVTCQNGVADVVVEVSLDGIDYVSTNIAINKKEIAITDFEKVSISYV